MNRRNMKQMCERNKVDRIPVNFKHCSSKSVSRSTSVISTLSYIQDTIYLY